MPHVQLPIPFVPNVIDHRDLLVDHHNLTETWNFMAEFVLEVDNGHGGNLNKKVGTKVGSAILSDQME